MSVLVTSAIRGLLWRCRAATKLRVHMLVVHTVAKGEFGADVGEAARIAALWRCAWTRVGG